MIVAIDGPAAAGKGTLARRLAEHLGFAYLETGLLYRAAARKLLDQNGDPNDAQAATRLAAALAPEDLAKPGLREERVGEAASRVATYPEVRAALLDFQRRFAAQPPGGKAGAVLDGRDIGTAVCPQAEVKLFVTASLEERASRRLHEIQARGEAADLAAVLADLRRRDERDSARTAAPLALAADAHLLDTTNLSIDGAFAQVLALVKAAAISNPDRA